MADGPKGDAMRIDTALVKQLAKLCDSFLESSPGDRS